MWRRTAVVMGPRMIWGNRDERVAESGRRRHAAEAGTLKTTPHGWHRDYSRCPLIFGAVPALFSLILLVPSHAAAGENEDIADLKRMLQELKAENRKLSQRLSTLERAPAARRINPATTHERATAVATAAAPAPAVAAPPAAPPTLPAPDLSEAAAKRPLGVRVKDLEVIWAAQENATRQIIRDSLSKTGPKINSFLSLSGVVEGVASRTGSFTGPTQENLALGTAELDFDIKLSDWLTGALVLHFDNGTGAIFPTGNQPVVPTNIPGVGVDRFTLDRTHISVGDLMQFPIAARFGVEVLHFGTSTGVARLDTLSIGTPLTTEVFENRQTAGGLEFAWPTPPRQPPPAPVVVPRVSPLVVAPAVSQLMRWLGYTPLPERPFRPTPVTFPFDPAPFYGSVMAYRGSDSIIPGRTKIDDYNASLGFRTRGHCGVPYDQLKDSLICPWTLDFHVDYDTSVFESRFLRTSYLPFLSQIGRIPGVAASLKTSFGPFAFVGEVNAAIQDARFIDGLGITRNMMPMTWQASIAYQFDWNPWIQEIGAQGDYISVGYSGSKDMSGVSILQNGIPTRIGFVPQHRLFLTGGEWVMDGLKVAVEYSANWDYPVSAGGTGRVAHGWFGLIQLNF
ncbi:hypothetical protein [Bradyrhizobium lablabi]|uniref:hypothetical protein n=1 Tax=Bradyrhizobium lablabi TaxID=722472 RepID=UPI000B0D1BC4|nr:hypothetical protein [Bradyrhizobium lablabi]